MKAAEAQFLCSAPKVADLGQETLPEVGVIGRSNVGKSSLVGMVLGSISLVRTSKTPGRTQMLNVFLWRRALHLVDMPGYGFAKVSKQLRAKMWELSCDYIVRRAGLKGLVVVLDIRREQVSKNDFVLVNLALKAQRPLLLAFNKCDLMPKTILGRAISRLEQQLGMPPGCSLPVSCKTGLGLQQLRQRLWEVGCQP